MVDGTKVNIDVQEVQSINSVLMNMWGPANPCAHALEAGNKLAAVSAARRLEDGTLELL